MKKNLNCGNYLKSDFKKIFLGTVILIMGGCFAFAQNRTLCSKDNSKTFKNISMVNFPTENVLNMGQDVQSDTSRRIVKPFSINKYETTYGLWYQTRVKAEKIGYVFGNKGKPGSDGKTGVSASEHNFAMPVTNINWYDAIVWCNALSELKNLTPCYTYEGEILRDSTDARCDLAVCNWEADGYRLPAEAEWEYAARRTKAGFQAGNLASGQIDENGKSSAMRDYSEVCWDVLNSECACPVGAAGGFFGEDGYLLAGSGNPNGAGIYDMSGNVLEYCWDWFSEYTVTDNATGPEIGYERVGRGGSFSEFTPFIYCGDRYSFDPNSAYDYIGFRIVRSLISDR